MDSPLDPQTQNLLRQLHRAKTMQVRKKLIHEAEQQGYIVRWRIDRYVLLRADQTYRLPNQVCPQCGRRRLLADFWGVQGALHPWCVSCRKSQPEAARKAFDHMRAQVAYQQMSQEERLTWQARVKQRKRSRFSAEALQVQGQEDEKGP